MTEMLLRYATKRIVELESLLLVGSWFLLVKL